MTSSGQVNIVYGLHDGHGTCIVQFGRWEQGFSVDEQAQVRKGVGSVAQSYIIQAVALYIDAVGHSRAGGTAHEVIVTDCHFLQKLDNPVLHLSKLLSRFYCLLLKEL